MMKGENMCEENIQLRKRVVDELHRSVKRNFPRRKVIIKVRL